MAAPVTAPKVLPTGQLICVSMRRPPFWAGDNRDGYRRSGRGVTIFGGNSVVASVV
jgi:hypothetical protein